jgi:hypothetical protein
VAASADCRFTKYIHLQQPHDGKFKNPNFYGKSPIEPIIRTQERLQIKKVIDKKVAQNSKCFYNLFIKIFIQSHMKKKTLPQVHPLATRGCKAARFSSFTSDWRAPMARA